MQNIAKTVKNEGKFKFQKPVNIQCLTSPNSQKRKKRNGDLVIRKVVQNGAIRGPRMKFKFLKVIRIMPNPGQD